LAAGAPEGLTGGRLTATNRNLSGVSAFAFCGYGGVRTALCALRPAGSSRRVSDDKPEVAMPVACSGSAANLKTAALAPRQVRNAVYAVLHTPRYRERAEVFGCAVRPLRCSETAVETVEGSIAH